MHSGFILTECIWSDSSYAEQLVLYMKAEEFLSSALHTAKESIKQGQLQASPSVKQGEIIDMVWDIPHFFFFFQLIGI